MFFGKIIECLRGHFKQDSLHCYDASTDHEFLRAASLLTLMRLAEEDSGELVKQVRTIAEQHVPEIVVPDREKCWHLLQIAKRFAALGELFRIDLLPLVQPILLDGLREFGEVKPIYYIIGPTFPESSGDLREQSLRYYCHVSHYAHIDISNEIAVWRTAIVQHLQSHRKAEQVDDAERAQEWEENFGKEMVVIDRAIADYKPLPGSQPL